MLKRTIPSAGLAVLPRTGHTCNLEQPAVFNLSWSASSPPWRRAWGLRDPRSLGGQRHGHVAALTAAAIAARTDNPKT